MLSLVRRSLGVNFVRAAHYHIAARGKAADEMGLLLWERFRSTGISTGRIQRPCELQGSGCSVGQRDWNRASVVVWSVANETTYSEPRMAFLNRLIQDVRELDDTRLVSAALLGDTRRELQHVVTYLRPMDSFGYTL